MNGGDTENLMKSELNYLFFTMNKKAQLEGYHARSIKKFANHTRGDGI